jgi:hypothetical protein
MESRQALAQRLVRATIQALRRLLPQQRPQWQPGTWDMLETAADSGADRRSAKIAGAPLP